MEQPILVTKIKAVINIKPIWGHSEFRSAIAGIRFTKADIPDLMKEMKKLNIIQVNHRNIKVIDSQPPNLK